MADETVRASNADPATAAASTRGHAEDVPDIPATENDGFLLFVVLRCIGDSHIVHNAQRSWNIRCLVGGFAHTSMACANRVLMGVLGQIKCCFCYGRAGEPRNFGFMVPAYRPPVLEAWRWGFAIGLEDFDKDSRPRCECGSVYDLHSRCRHCERQTARADFEVWGTELPCFDAG